MCPVRTESGTISYTYDDSGNLRTRTDARATKTLSYDGMNRLTGFSYSGGTTPAVSLTYDQSVDIAGHLEANYPKGRLVRSEAAGVSRTDYRYDALGRVQASQQVPAGGDPYGFGYAYDLAGELTSMTYPSGRTLAMSYEAAGRTASVGGYATNIRYAAHGGLSRMTLGTGNGLIEETCYDPNRMQVTGIRVGAQATNCQSQGTDLLKLGFGYGTASANNGNVRSQTIAAGGATFSQSYGYDSFNRLASASEGTAWSRGFGYDAFGNMWVNAYSGIGPDSFTPQTEAWYATDAHGNKTNRFGATMSIGYDGAGAMTSIGAFGFTYDAEGRLATSTNGAQTTYSYDGDGRRVKKVQGGATTLYVYDAAGQLAAEYSTAAPQELGTQYVTVDHLGSTRLVINAAGAAVKRYDYLPFGEEIPAGVGGRTAGMGYQAGAFNPKFTGKERDAESGLDFFGARYFSGAQGRFTSPDPGNFGSALMDPQSWNAYGYSRNNPLKYTDPTGLAYTVCQTDENHKEYNCGTVDDKNEQAFLQSLSDSGLTMTSGGRILNATGDQIGTASYFSQAQQNSDLQAAQFLTNQVGPLVNGLGYATGGVLLGAGVGAAYGAIAGGSTALSIPVTSGGTATAATYQLLKDSYKNLELVGEALSGVGQRLIAAGDEIRDVGRLVSQYGGKASDWVKLSTSGVDPSKMQVYAQRAGRGTPIEMHYYKNIVTGAIVEMKSVFSGIH